MIYSDPGITGMVWWIATLTRSPAGVFGLGFGARGQEGFFFVLCPSVAQLPWPLQNGSLRHRKCSHCQGALNHFEAAQ
jgi:hypothetical protein